MSQPYGVPVLESAIPLSQGALDLVKRGVATLWSRISTGDPRAEDRPLLLSYDVHPTPLGPVLIEINTNGLPLQSLGDGCDAEVVLRDCADDHVHTRRVLCELREAVIEQVGKDQTDRLRRALSDALNALSA